MKRTLLLTTIPLLFILAIGYCLNNSNTVSAELPEPTNGKKYRDNQDEEDPNRRDAWIELIHKAAPGTDWKAMDREAARALARSRKYVAPSASTRSVEAFADSLLQGEWFERGSKNQAGSMRAITYVKETNKIYGVADGGSLWRGNLDGSDWTVLNDDFLLNPDILKAFYPTDSTNVRLIGSSGKFIIYSDDEGQSWTDANFTPAFYDGWGSPKEVVLMNDSLNTIYYLAHTWDETPWAPRSWLYRSTDGGANFERVKVFNLENKQRVSLWSPYKSTEAYVLEGGATLHYFDADTTYSTAITGLLDEGDVSLTGFKGDSTLILYALEEDKHVYKSYDGINWDYQSELPANAWNVGMACSPFDSLTLFSGAVDCHYSIYGGQNLSWFVANVWWEYYDDPDLLHADIMDFQFFETADSIPFLLISNHGGLHVTYDHLASTQNIGLENMNIGQYYDVITNQDDPSYMYVGSQDQGWQWSDEGEETSTVDFIQQWSGDYGQLMLTRDYQSFWPQYPGGIIDYYHNAKNPPNPWPESEYNVEGEHMPAVNWIIPTASMEAFPEMNTVFVGGGNINGGPGSYLIMLTPAQFPPYNIAPIQINYDFRANSNTGEGLISAIEQSTFFEGNRLYVSTSDGSFFTSSDFGDTWQKSPGFSGPMTNWLYTGCILASKIDPEVVYVSGSGYSNPPVLKSVDGGVTFEPISNGLPNTLVQEIVANADETLLFAATTLGPFVYITWEDQWYPLLGESTPLQWYTSVEYIESKDLVRFGTFGRGIWDFEIRLIEEPPVAVFENNPEVAVNVYPNPITSDRLLNIKIDWPQMAGFTLSDVNGKILRKTNVQEFGQLSLDGLAPGTYFYQVTSTGRLINRGQILVF